MVCRAMLLCATPIAHGVGSYKIQTLSVAWSGPMRFEWPLYWPALQIIQALPVAQDFNWATHWVQVTWASRVRRFRVGTS